MTRGERVRAAARTLRTSRSASWIANETDVSTKTAQKYLAQLVEDNVLRRVEQGDQTLYCIDRPMATYREIAALQRERDREELTVTLDSMQARSSERKDEYGVETPDELRASIEFGHLEGTLRFCERCSLGWLATYWTRDLGNHAVSEQ